MRQKRLFLLIIVISLDYIVITSLVSSSEILSGFLVGLSFTVIVGSYVVFEMWDD